MSSLEYLVRFAVSVAAYRASDEIRERTGQRTSLDLVADEVHPGAPPEGWRWSGYRNRA